MTARILTGAGLFTGRTATVRLEARSGPITLGVAGRAAALAAFRPRAEGRTSILEAPEHGLRVSCVEHFFAAVAALGIAGDLAIEADEDELPLLDGGATAWAHALGELALARHAPPLVVAREGTVRFGRSEYRFTPGDGVTCSAWFETDDARLRPDASWHGDARDFVERIACARTFVDERELAGMMAQGFRATVEPTSVIVVGPEAIHAAGRPFEADEPARHKLLDLIGDLALHGGPPRGSVVARRPGHAATHFAVARALEEGILTRCP